MKSPDELLKEVYHLRKTQEAHLSDEKNGLGYIEEMLLAQSELLEQIRKATDSVNYFQTRVRARNKQVKASRREAKRLQRSIDRLLQRYYDTVRLEDA